MMKRLFLIFWINTLFLGIAFSQLENIIVEQYYVSDANDATDTLGGLLEEGSVTYRIYVDLAPGSRLLNIYGDENHPLTFSSTAPFFNHKEETVTFAKDLNKNRLDEGTVALDSWLTIGQVSKVFGGSTAYFAVPKDKDTDGSIIGGANNDGGSDEIPGGLLVNADADAGIPLTTSDGLVEFMDLPENWVDIDFVSPLDGEDSTIFGLNDVLEFSSNEASLSNSGATGSSDDNEVIIAQLTTKGALSFNINLTIQFEQDGETQIVNYVSDNNVVLDGETFNPLLSYPWTCGCTDPDYLEASPDFACSDDSQCITPIVYGCLDSLACNFDPEANFNIEDLCCFVGYCNDRDISLACPELPELRVAQLAKEIDLSPNPASDFFNVHVAFEMEEQIPFVIYDALGLQRLEGRLRGPDQMIETSSLQPGLYFIRFEIEHLWVSKPVTIF